MATKTERDVFHGLDFDIESMLDNDIKHFRSVHIMCMSRFLPGSIIESNCGQLYRTTAKRALDSRDSCPDCLELSGKLPCPACGNPIASPPLFG